MAVLITLKAWDSCRVWFSGSNIPFPLIYQAFDLMSVLNVGTLGPEPNVKGSHTQQTPFPFKHLTLAGMLGLRPRLGAQKRY